MTATHLTPRRLGIADLDSVCDLLTASDMAVLGHSDFTPDDIAADLKRDDLEAYGVDDGTGRLVGYAWTAVHGDSERADVDVYVHPEHHEQSLGPALLAYVEARAAALVAPAGHDQAVLDLGVYRQDERTKSWLTERGFEVGTTFVRMRIDFDGPLPETALPDGVTVRLVEDEPDLRAAHDVFERGFVEHYSHTWTSYEHWYERLTERGPGFARVWLAELDGSPAGMLVGTRHFEPDDDAGYVRTLATAPDARGRGVGKALLRTYFRVCRAEGRTAVYLHVDVANVTDALRLYESVGMRSFLTIDAWSKRVPVSG